MKSESTTQLRLEGHDTTFMICADVWRELVEIASKKGWRSVHAPACYWADIGLEVTATDARRLALVFEALGDDLVHNLESSVHEDVSQLIADLGDILILCRSGGFRVC